MSASRTAPRESAIVRRILSVALLLALSTGTSGAIAQTPPVTLGNVRTPGAPWLAPLYRRVLTRAMPRYVACATAAWRTAPEIAGTLTVGFSYFTTSPVHLLRVLENGLIPAAPSLASCVLLVTRRLPFPDDIEGGGRVSFTLRITPSSPALPSPPEVRTSFTPTGPDQYRGRSWRDVQASEHGSGALVSWRKVTPPNKPMVPTASAPPTTNPSRSRHLGNRLGRYP